jgi:hypothetical protein
MTLYDTYMDVRVSGVTLARPALQQLLADCRAGKIGVVLARDADRLSRDTSQLFALLHRFAIYGVRVQFANENGENGSCSISRCQPSPISTRPRLSTTRGVSVPTHSDQLFRLIPISCSDRFRSVVPIDPDHRFRVIPISLWRSVSGPVG